MFSTSKPGHEIQEMISVPKSNVDEMRMIFAKEKGMMKNQDFRETDYLRGLHNGMEMLMAKLDGRKPQLIMKINRLGEDTDDGS